MPQKKKKIERMKGKKGGYAELITQMDGNASSEEDKVSSSAGTGLLETDAKCQSGQDLRQRAGVMARVNSNKFHDADGPERAPEWVAFA